MRIEDRNMTTLRDEVGLRVMLHWQTRPRFVHGEFDIRWFRSLWR